MSDDSSKTFAPSSRLRDLVPLQGAEGPKRHADLHFRKITNAVKGGHAKCFHCPYPATAVSVVQVTNPDGLLIHACCDACLDMQDEAVHSLKNDMYAIAVSYKGRDGDLHVKGLGGHKVGFPDERIALIDASEDTEES